MDSLLRFESTIKSPVTKKNYRLNIDLFKKFIGATDYDSMLSIPKETLQDRVWNLIIIKTSTVPFTIKVETCLVYLHP